MAGECKRNYQKELDSIICELTKKNIRPRLLLHACCAPCSSYCLEYLSNYFEITVLFYNPNIFPEDEYNYRASELCLLVSRMPLESAVKVVVLKYDSIEFTNRIKGLENEPERGSRCTVCYRLRLEKAAEYAKQQGFDYFTTTLSISPYKDAERLVNIGEELGKAFGIPYLVSDFKKKNGYKRSIELSNEYGLYRQDYCGCQYSKK